MYFALSKAGTEALYFEFIRLVVHPISWDPNKCLDHEIVNLFWDMSYILSVQALISNGYGWTI